MVLHHCSVDSTLIWDPEPLCLCIQGVAAVWFIHTPFWSRSAWGGMWGSGLHSTSRDQFKPCFIRVTRVEASCLCFSVSACESRSWIRLERSREGSQGSSSLLTLFKWTLDFQKRELLNSAVGPLRGHGSCLEGPPAPRVRLTTPEALLCNIHANHHKRSFFHY